MSPIVSPSPPRQAHPQYRLQKHGRNGPRRRGGSRATSRSDTIFVTDGPEAALAQAKEAAGAQDVLINGGADVARQYLNAGLIDETAYTSHPVVLNASTALFEGCAPTCTSPQRKRPTRHR